MIDLALSLFLSLMTMGTASEEAGEFQTENNTQLESTTANAAEIDGIRREIQTLR